MATKTFEELKQMAIQIRDEKANKQNTATRIGTQMLEHLNKLEQEYYNKQNIDEQKKQTDVKFSELDKKFNELNISALYPTQGIGGTNKYDLAGAIAQVPAEYRTIVGLKITFINNETSKTETWKYDGGAFTITTNWKQDDGSGGNKTLEWNIDVATTRKQVLLQDRKKLLQISYKNGNGDVINEQYVGTTFTDSEWIKDTNWEKIPNQAQIGELDKQINENILLGQIFNRVPWEDGRSLGGSGVGPIVKEGYSLIQNIPVKNGDKFHISYSGSLLVSLRNSSKKHLEYLLNTSNTVSQTLKELTINNELAAFVSISKQTDKNVGCTLFQKWEDKLNVADYERIEHEKYDAELPIKYEKYLLTNPSSINWITGSISDITGEDETNNGERRTDYIPVGDKEYFIKYTYGTTDRQYAEISGYNEDKGFIGVLFKDSIDTNSADRKGKSYYLRINDVFTSETSFFRVSRHYTTELELKENSNKEISDDYDSRITINKLNLNLLDSDKASIRIGKNKYKRGTGLDVKPSYINSEGKIVSGNGNGGVTAPIRIKKGETLKFPGFISALGSQQSYAALYDIYDNPIPETIIQSDTLSWVEGAVYARWSTGADIIIETNIYYCYEINTPLYAWEAYEEYVDESLIPDKDIASYRFIDVVGDSIGSQIGSAMAKMNTINPLGNHTIRNKCIGGESCLDTLAHLGVIPYAIEPFTIPSDTNTIVDINISTYNFLKTVIDEDGVSKKYIHVYKNGENGDAKGSSDGINPYGVQKSFVNGILGNLLFKRQGQGSRDTYGFQRLEAGEETVIDSVSYAKPAVVTRDTILVCFMGTNGGWNPIDLANKSGDSEYPNLTLSLKECADILVGYYKELSKLCAPQYNDYLFLGFYMTAFVDQKGADKRKAFWSYFDMRMEQEFGFRYLNVRKYLMEYGWKDAGYQLGFRLVSDPEGGEGAYKYTCLPEDVEADTKAIKEGRIPWCIVNGESGVHMLAKPSACVANQVFKRLYEINAISEYRQIDISSIKDAENADINQPDYGS